MTSDIQRRKHREGDGIADVISNFISRYRIIGVLIWSVIGGLVTAAVYKQMALDRIDGINVRIISLETWRTTTDLKVDSIRTNTSILVKKACLELSKTDQDYVGMICPPSLYKGAPR